MPDALTPQQVQLLRRAREETRWYREPRDPDDLREAVFLSGIGLLEYVGLPSLFALTSDGRAYLAAIEASVARLEADGPS